MIDRELEKQERRYLERYGKTLGVMMISIEQFPGALALLIVLLIAVDFVVITYLAGFALFQIGIRYPDFLASIETFAQFKGAMFTNGILFVVLILGLITSTHAFEVLARKHKEVSKKYERKGSKNE